MSAPIVRVVLVLTVLFLPQSILAQGILLPQNEPGRFILPRPGIPIPPQRASYKIEQISIDANVDGQIARTSVTQTFRNTGSVQIDVSFIFPLPYDGAIDQLTFLVDGKEYAAKLMDADQARKIYESYVRRNRDPALLEWIGTGMFQSSVFPIPPGAERTITLKYSQLLRKDSGTIDYLFPLATAKYTSEPVEKLTFRVAIQSDVDLKNIYSPNYNIRIDRDDDRHAVARYEATRVIPGSDFRLVWGLDNRDIGANLLSYWPEGEDQGYFLLLASPRIARKDSAPANKNVIFVVDRSGSMSGKKIEQAREAAKFVLNNLRDGDRFNIIAYDDDVEAFAPELQRYSDESRARGIGFINGIQSGGSTNIDSALAQALASVPDEDRPTYIVFLTDGQPTAGETNEMKIARNALQRNRHQARVIAFGVGFDVNSRLIDRLTRDNHGQSLYVRPDEDLEKAVATLYKKIAAPVMTDVQVEYQFANIDVEMGPPTNRVYPTGRQDLFAGSQLVMVGRYKKSGPAQCVIRGNVGGSETTFRYDVQFATATQSDSHRYIQKLWAMRRIGEIIDLIDLEGKNDERIAELVALSKRFGIVTPYTSFLADDTQALRDFSSRATNNAMAGEELSMLDSGSGRSGFGQRAFKGQLKNVPNAAALPQQSGQGQGLAAGNPGFGGGGGRNGDAPSLNGLRQNQGATVYKKGKLLLADNAADVDPEKMKDQITEIKQFSDEYFQLIQRASTYENRLLAQQGPGEELIVRVGGKLYRIQ